MPGTQYSEIGRIDEQTPRDEDRCPGCGSPQLYRAETRRFLDGDALRCWACGWTTLLPKGV